MRFVTRAALCCAICLLTAAVASAQQGAKKKSFHTEGVFSNIEVGPGGDYGGMQVYLTEADGEFYAVVTVAQGVLLPPVLVKVKAQVEERKIEFTLPEGEESRTFTGVVTAEGLTLTENGQRHLLKRKCYD